MDDNWCDGGAVNNVRTMNSTRIATIGAVVVLVLAVAWFLMSFLAMGTPPVDAAGEALGVLLGFGIVGSVVGAVLSSRKPTEARDTDEADDARDAHHDNR
jgi:hypothetical protein